MFKSYKNTYQKCYYYLNIKNCCLKAYTKSIRSRYFHFLVYFFCREFKFCCNILLYEEISYPSLDIYAESDFRTLKNVN